MFLVYLNRTYQLTNFSLLQDVTINIGAPLRQASHIPLSINPHSPAIVPHLTRIPAVTSNNSDSTHHISDYTLSAFTPRPAKCRI
jgi:hypothetical protein